MRTGWGRWRRWRLRSGDRSLSGIAAKMVPEFLKLMGGGNMEKACEPRRSEALQAGDRGHAGGGRTRTERKQRILRGTNEGWGGRSSVCGGLEAIKRMGSRIGHDSDRTAGYLCSGTTQCCLGLREDKKDWRGGRGPHLLYYPDAGHREIFLRASDASR
jgi:hypothetical protein